MRPVTAADIGFYCDRIVYGVDLDSKSLMPFFYENKKLRFPTVGSSGKLSRIAPVTLTGEEADKANIPRGALDGKFAFVYPLEGLGHISVESEKALAEAAKVSVELSLVFNGGFVYWDRDGNIVQINAIVDAAAADGLCFDGPNDLSPVLKTQLRDSSLDFRLQPPTFTFLKTKGVEWFAWIPPGHLGAEGAGAFVYMFKDNGLDCYFSVSQRRADDGADDGAEDDGTMGDEVEDGD